jgi:V8-like Glu-specific endopeptidase
MLASTVRAAHHAGRHLTASMNSIRAAVVGRVGPSQGRTCALAAAVFAALLATPGCGKRGGGDDDAPRRAETPAPAPATSPQGRGYADRCEASPSADDDAAKTTFYAVTGAMTTPFRAVARIDVADGFLCSGVLVSPTRVLTAAHCFESTTVVDGVHFVEGDERAETLAQAAPAKLHPDYAAALATGQSLATHAELADVDVAVLELTSAVTERTPVAFAASDRLAPGKLVALVGYGDTGLGAGTKRFAQSHVGRRVDDEKDAGLRFHDLLLLDSQKGTGACPGDSGGGVFVKGASGYELLGVVNGVNDVLYPGFPVDSCGVCPRGIGIVTLAAARRDFLRSAGVPAP